MMPEKILYYADYPSKKVLPFPFSTIKTSKIKDAYKEDVNFIIFEENFLKRRKRLNLSKFSNKACFIYFSEDGKDNLNIVREFGVFDYFTSQESKTRILFKLKRAKKFLNLKMKIGNLEGELLEKDKRIKKITLIDPLTNCYNWRYFLQRARQELSYAHKHNYNISFIIVDIDYFRQINEIYSVKVADSVIKEMVDVLRRHLRKKDIIARWREDEFFIILPHFSKSGAHKVAEKLKDRLTSYKFQYKKLVLTIKTSLGVVSFPDDKISNTRDVINALDNCLIAAKKRGGDVVVSYSQKQRKFTYQEKKEANIDELKQKIEKLNILLTRDLLEMIYGFARAIGVKDYYTGTHVEYTASIAEEIAKELKLPKPEIENVKRAAVLHDLGKVGIDEKILSKKGTLNIKEWDAVRCHPWVATEILREIHALRGAIPAILYHHERYDGGGYPLGLKGDEIPLSARIVALADVYQALISDRPYRRAQGRREAIKVIKKETGEHFDPKVVDVFLKVIKKVK